MGGRPRAAGQGIPGKLPGRPGPPRSGQRGPGSRPTFELRLDNSGMRLLYGSITAADSWLTLGDAPGVPQKHFQFTHEQVLRVRVHRERMRAGSKPLEGRLHIQSSGGAAVVTVRAEVPIQPFPGGVLAGALSPRQVAEKAKANPKEAALHF